MLHARRLRAFSLSPQRLTCTTHVLALRRAASGGPAPAPTSPPERPQQAEQLDGFMRHVSGSGGGAGSASLAAFQSSALARRIEIDGARVEITFQLENVPGALVAALQCFAEQGVSLSHIESRQTKTRSARVEFMVSVMGGPSDPSVAAVLKALRARRAVLSVSTVAPTVVPWFPTHVSGIDAFSTKTLDAGAELEADHPGFHDAAYRARRRAIVAAAASYEQGAPIPRVNYTAEENATWRVVYERLRAVTERYAVDSYNEILPLLEAHCGYGPGAIPQLEDISAFLKSRTGFTLRPVAGLLSARDFLNGLAFRVFFSTQYIRHHTRPLYTPEPDVCHELLGHAPMFADPDFADFSHEIGLASLGASDEDIARLATCYWFSVEFGLVRGADGRLRAYGAGLLSSFGELEYACSPTRPAGGEAAFPEYRPWDPAKAASQAYPITRYQPVYYVADSLADAKVRMRDFCERKLTRRFLVTYDPATQSVAADRAIIRGRGSAPGDDSEYVVSLPTPAPAPAPPAPAAAAAATLAKM